MAIDRTSDTFLLDAYTGKGGFASGEYLISHPRESVDKFSRRKELAVYPNFCRKIVDVFMGFLWKQAPAREIDDLYAQFAENADGAGTKLNTLLFTYQRLAMIVGTVFVIVDKPQTQGQTRADQALPYLALRLKSQLVAEIKNAAGIWQSVTFSETLDGETVYRTYTKTGWRLSKNIGGKPIDQGEYDLGRVPVVRLHIAKPINPTDTSGDSFFYDLAGLNWALYNLDSEQRELFRSQTFAILALPVADDAEREKLKDMTIGTENALTYNAVHGGNVPSFIAPPPDPIQLYAEKMAAVVTDIYRVANLEFVGGVQQSGVALSFHFQECNSSLGGMAEMCEAAENEIAALVYAWQGKEFNGNIAYSSDFNMADLQQAINTAMDSVNLGMGAEFEKAIKKRLAKQILGNDTAPSTLEAIDKEIDAQGDAYGDRVKRQAQA